MSDPRLQSERAASARTPQPDWRLPEFEQPGLEAFAQRLAERRVLLGVLGLGYVGLPLALNFARAGFHVVGYDTDPTRVARLQRGECYLPHLGQALRDELAGGRFLASGEEQALVECEALLVCVPTPLGAHREPDLGCVRAATASVARMLRPGGLVILCSTTYPGTTRELMLPALEAGGLRLGRDFWLAFAPEREDPGRSDWESTRIPRLVGGLEEYSGRAAQALLSAAFERVLRVRSAEVAESAKLLENLFRAVNIALINELKLILEALGLDVWEVVEAAATKPYGFMRFEPGPGLGGHCIPIDPFYLEWAARRAGASARFVELAGEINTQMPEHVVHKTLLALNQRGRALQGARVLVLGLSYKADVADMRESPALRLIERFEQLGALVTCCDPLVDPEEARRELRGRARLVPLERASLEQLDALVIATAHRAFDWELVAEHAPLVIDTRDALGARLAGDPRYWSA